MSWSLNAVVRNSAAGRAKLAERFATNNEYLKEPERSIKDKAAGLVLLTLESMPDNTPVQVSASGSAWMDGDVSKTQLVKVDVQPIHGDFIDAG